jgi:hypothetical protein
MSIDGYSFLVGITFGLLLLVIYLILKGTPKHCWECGDTTKYSHWEFSVPGYREIWVCTACGHENVENSDFI